MQKRKFWIVILGILLFFGQTTPISFMKSRIYAEENDEAETGAYEAKDEVIYGNLDVYGKPENLYVVNSFHITSQGHFIDYGTYTEVRNLTNLEAIEQVAGHQTRFFAEEGEFYYQGELGGRSLPWDITITYLFDGEEVNPKELAGKSGHLEVQIKTSPNEEADPLFFEHYLLQISLTLDPEIFKDIQAPKGIEANAGKNKQMNFTVLPEKEEELILSAKVTNLEMDPIDISAIPANIAIDSPDVGEMTDGMASLAEAIEEINDGVSDLNEGAKDLKSGTSELSEGSSQFNDGLKELNQSSGELVRGSNEIKKALEQIAKELERSPEMPDMDEIKELPQSLREIAEGLERLSGRFAEIQDGFINVRETIEEAVKAIPNERLDKEDFEKIYASEMDPDTIEILIENYMAAQIMKELYSDEDVQKIFDAIDKMLDGMPDEITQVVSFLDLMANGIENSLKQLEELEALEELQTGLATLSTEYGSFHHGLTEFTGGLGALASSYTDLDQGIQDVSEGTTALQGGVHELNEGTQELYKETSDLPGQMESEIDKFMAEYDFANFEPQSFVSTKNEDIGVVQFVLQTESIQIKEPEEPEDVPEEQKGFWSRLFDLFR